jgi:hypothetical protein
MTIRWARPFRYGGLLAEAGESLDFVETITNAAACDECSSSGWWRLR